MLAQVPLPWSCIYVHARVRVRVYVCFEVCGRGRVEVCVRVHVCVCFEVRGTGRVLILALAS